MAQPVVKVHGVPISTNVRRVLATLEELHVPYELVTVDLMKGAHKNPEYVEKYHPFGQVPALEDSDGTILFESRAIARYLAVKYGKGSHSLYPVNDVHAYGAVEQWLAVEADEYNPKVSTIVYEVMFKKAFGRGDADAAVVKAQVEKLGPVLDVLEKHLAKSKNDFIAGKNLTLADISFLPWTEYLVQNPEHAKLIEDRPHLAAWWKRIRALPSWQKLTKK